SGCLRLSVCVPRCPLSVPNKFQPDGGVNNPTDDALGNPLACGRVGGWTMRDQSWKWAVDIQEIGGRLYVGTIEDGNVRIRGFDHLSDAEHFAEGERERLGVSK